MLKGKLKEEFDVWFRNYCKRYEYLRFTKTINDMPFELQRGVYEAFFDSKGYYIKIDPYIGGGACVYYLEIIWRRADDWVDTYWNPEFDNKEVAYFNSRQEAFKEAINKLNDILN